MRNRLMPYLPRKKHLQIYFVFPASSFVKRLFL